METIWNERERLVVMKFLIMWRTRSNEMCTERLTRAMAIWKQEKIEEVIVEEDSSPFARLKNALPGSRSVDSLLEIQVRNPSEIILIM